MSIAQNKSSNIRSLARRNGSEETVVEFKERFSDDSLQKFQDADPEPLTLTKSQLVELWENGFINDAAYVALALKMEGDSKSLDYEHFCFVWRSSVDDNGKCKELKPSQVEKIFADLKKKGGVQVRQLPIEFSLLF